MIKIINKNILDCTENIIVHQVNCQGIMGAGLARQLADKYKGLEENYRLFCESNNYDYALLRGRVLTVNVDNKIICNMFSQTLDCKTAYISMKTALTTIKNMAKDLNLSIAMPYNIGCGIADGEWEIVEQIIADVFDDYEVTIYRLKE